MADIGPSGQPLPPSNPFAAQSGMSGNLSISTGSAQKAFDDLQSSLDKMMKSFGGSWDKVTKDSLAGQERFYKYIGDKENERRVSLERYKKAALDSVNDELRAKISSIEQTAQAEKTSQDELQKKKVSAAQEARKQVENINREADRKEAQSRSVFGRIGNGVSSLGNQIGGPIGGLVSGVGNVLTNPAEIIPAAMIGALIEILNTKAAFTGTGARLAGAGFGLGAGASAGLDFTTGLFGGPTSPFGRALSQSQQRDIVSMMAGSRTMIDQTRTGGMEGIQGNLGLFANILPDASKEMEIFTDATKNLGMSQKDISTTFVTSRVNAERLKITQLDAIQTQMDMQKALRNITNDGTVASSVLANISGVLNTVGASEGEKQRIGLNIAQAGANLSLPQVAGMFAFTHGGKMPTQEDIFGMNGVGGMMGKQGTGVFGLMGSFLSKVGGQTKDPMQRMFMADQLNKQFNLGLRTQDLPQFFNLSNSLMSGNIGPKDFAKQVEGLTKHTQMMAIEGMDKLVSVVNPIQQLENVFTNFWTKLDQLLSHYFGQNTKSSNFLHNAPRANTDRKPTAGKGFDVYKGH